ncbi:hypothetical protein, partial [Gilliamella sp. Fer4-1]
IKLTQLDLLTQYFKIENTHITPLKPYLITEVLFSGIAFVLAFIILLANIITMLSSPWVIDIIIATLTVFIIVTALFLFAVDPIKRFKTYLFILKDNAFLQRANDELAKIIEDKNC